MKLIGIVSTATLSLLLGMAAPVYAQQEQQDEKKGHPEQQQGKHEQAKPDPQHLQQQERQDQNKQQEHAQQQQRQDQNKQQERAQQQQRQDDGKQQQHAEQQQQWQDQNKEQERAGQQQRRDQNEQQQQRADNRRDNERPRRTQEQQRVQQSAWQEHRSQRWDSDHRTWQQRGGYNGYRIPDDRFRGYFGQDHGFRIYGLPFMVVGGYPRFQYGGYWITTVDPWPEYWGNDWYDNDDVYVTYVDNGYYLYNRRYPNVGIAISISM
jgi:hypothetical protein